MDLLVADQIGQVHKLRFFLDEKKEAEKELWYPVPQPLEPVQLMITVDKTRILLVRRTGIFQLLDREEATLLGAAKMENLQDGLDFLEGWTRAGKIQVLLSNGQIWNVAVDENEISFSLNFDMRITKPIAGSCLSGENIIAVAGKDLLPSVYRMEGDEVTKIFTAKQPRPDKLGMHIKVDIRSLTFLDEHTLVAGTGKGEIWVYDIQKDKSVAVREKKVFEGKPVISLSPLDDETVLASDNRGTLESFSIEPISRTGGFKGHSGAVNHALVSDTFVVSSSSDRFVFCFSREDRKQLFKLFLGHQPTALLCLKNFQKHKQDQATDDQLWAQLKKAKK